MITTKSANLSKLTSAKVVSFSVETAVTHVSVITPLCSTKDDRFVEFNGATETFSHHHM